MDPLFPELPEDLSGLTDEQLSDLLKEHEVAAELIENEDEDFTKGLSADEVLAELNRGVEQIETLAAEQKARAEQQETYLAEKAAAIERAKSALSAEAEGDDEDAGDEEGDEAEASESEPLAADVEETEVEETEEEEPAVVEPEVVASAAKTARPLRRPPAPSAERKAPEVGTVLVAAAGQVGIRGGQALDRRGLAEAIKKVAQSVGTPSKHAAGIEQRFLVASAEFHFPPERVLQPGEPDLNAEKIQQVIPSGIPGVFGNRALVASGGLCAPLEPLYSMPNFASQARPVRDALPSFQAARGGVNVPTATYIGDITTAISVIEESEDALGGTYATKSCQDLTCPDYTEVAVTIISHCREYGNLNARAWPEKIAHENDLTMAAHARSAEQYLLQRIRTLSLQVTQAAVGAQMNAFGSLVHAISKAAASVRFNLRMDPGYRFRVLMPSWIGDLLAADNALMQFDRYQAQAQLTAALERYGVSISYTVDDVGQGTSQGFAAEVDATAVDDFPDDVQYALFPEGAFIHVDGGSLELGLVRDSTLNSTNDFQLFGETFENVARLAPLQATRWITQDICPNGVFPALGTALSC